MSLAAFLTPSYTWLAQHEFRLAWRDWLSMLTGGKRRRLRVVVLAMIAFAVFMHAIAYSVVGRFAEIEVDAYPGRVFHGTVESLSPATGARFSLLPPDNATGNFTKVVQRIPVRIALDRVPPGVRLVVGRTATVVIDPHGG